jgi:anti-sigma regulatory factor (Ser/Thr protein kinase)
MPKIRARGEDVRSYILQNVEKHSADIARVTAEHFEITRQAVNKHLNRLVEEKALTQSGKTRSKVYKTTTLDEWRKIYRVAPNLAEDIVWRDDIKPVLGHLPENVLNIWQHGFTEMFNNAKDHSTGSEIVVSISRSAASIEMVVSDNGIGIFRKIQQEMDLLDERHAILELSKGKLTTDPRNHSGEGIFFTSRMFDVFDIVSGGVYYSHELGKPVEDWIMERKQTQDGTAIFMELSSHTARTTKKVFDKYSVGDDFGFNKTVIPVSLARYGNDQLISRSQAKRLLARVEKFAHVMFDYSDVDTIGQAFADEIYRVFAQQHPEITLDNVNETEAVRQMIQRARGGLENVNVPKP